MTGTPAISVRGSGPGEAFSRTIAEVNDGLQRIRLQRTGLSRRALMVGFEGAGRRYESPLNEISEGQRALIVLHALIHLSPMLGFTLFQDELKTALLWRNSNAGRGAF